jgi:TrmH family RNA methyltransferase
MITLRKLASLPQGTRVRKAVHLLEGAVRDLSKHRAIDYLYLAGVCHILQDSSLSEANKQWITQMERLLSSVSPDTQSIVRTLDDLVYRLQLELHIERADWDFYDPEMDRLSVDQSKRFPFTIVLDRLRSPFNVGSIFRTADSFGVSSILLIEPSAAVNHPRAQRSARGCISTIPWETLSTEKIESSLFDTPVFALELGGTRCTEFSFPSYGAMIVGSEELGVSSEMLAIADRSLGRVSIPLAGAKGSLNVSVAFGIVMHLWYTQITSLQDGVSL